MYPFHRKHPGSGNISSRHFSNGRPNEIKRDENGEATIEFDEKFYYERREPQAYFQKEVSTLTEKENILKSYILGDTGQLTPKNEEDEGISEAIDFSQKVSNDSSSISSNCSSPSPNNQKRTLNSDRSTSHSPKKDIKTNKSKVKDKIDNPVTSLKVPTIQISDNVGSQDIENDSFKVHPIDEISKKPHSTLDTTPECSDEESFGSDIGQKKENSDINLENKAEVEKLNVNSEVEKIDNNTLVRNSGNYSSREHQMKQLKRLLLASNVEVSKNWLGEGFIFDKSPTSYGLIQTKEGCSGVLAAVNAYVIKELLFKEIKHDIEFLRPQESQLEPALIEAMAEILWQAGDEKASMAVFETEPKEFNTIEDIINNIDIKTCNFKNDLHPLLRKNISYYTTPGCHGCVLFLMSAILSRGIENVIEDLNGVTSLITPNGYSTLELVNLLLTGIAVSNVFDNHIKLQYTTIRGIPKRSVIGYLSIKEHFKYCKVGSYLKTPRFPIWLVHSENQYTVLFSCTKQLLSDWKVERKFIMTYYDPLKRLGDEIRLTIDTTLATDENNERDNVRAIIENCVRTKWKDANITWK